MARHTKTKFAAMAITLVAALGVVAAGPMTAADAGKAPTVKMSRGIDCC